MLLKRETQLTADQIYRFPPRSRWRNSKLPPGNSEIESVATHRWRSRPGWTQSAGPDRCQFAGIREVWINGSMRHSLCERVATHVPVNRTPDDRFSRFPRVSKLLGQYLQNIRSKRPEPLRERHRLCLGLFFNRASGRSEPGSNLPQQLPTEQYHHQRRQHETFDGLLRPDGYLLETEH